MSKSNPIDWYSHSSKSKSCPSATPDAEGQYAKFNKTLDRLKFKPFRFETKHYMISVPEAGSYRTITAVNKTTLVAEFNDALIFPAGPEDQYYDALYLAACMRFVDWIKKKEASPFFNLNANAAESLTEAEVEALKNSYPKEPIKGYEH